MFIAYYKVIIFTYSYFVAVIFTKSQKYLFICFIDKLLLQIVWHFFCKYLLFVWLPFYEDEDNHLN